MITELEENAVGEVKFHLERILDLARNIKTTATEVGTHANPATYRSKAQSIISRVESALAELGYREEPPAT